jgi:hypothetical protein
MAADWASLTSPSRPIRAELASQVPLRPRIGADASSERNRISKRKRIEIAALAARNFILLGDPDS